MKCNVQNVISKVDAGELRCDKEHGDNVTNSRVVVVPPDGKSLLSKYLVAKKGKMFESYLECSKSSIHTSQGGISRECQCVL